MRNTHIDLLNVKVRLVTVSFFFMSFRKLSYKCVLGFLCLVFFKKKIFIGRLLFVSFP